MRRWRAPPYLTGAERMQEAGIDRESARLGLAKLLRSASDNLERYQLQDALTGPIARKDTKVIESHLKILEPQLKEIYQTLTSWLVS